MSDKAMPQATLKVRCTSCRKSHERNVNVMQPESFSKDGSRSVMSQFWCPLCGQVNAIRYEFYRNRKKEVCVRIKSKVKPVGNALIYGDEQEARPGAN